MRRWTSATRCFLVTLRYMPSRATLISWMNRLGESSEKPAQRPAKQRRAKTKHAARHVTLVRRQPLLVVDGDSLAHRSYHALPKTILGRGGKSSWCHSQLRQFIAATLPRRAAAPCAGRLGHARSLYQTEIRTFRRTKVGVKSTTRCLSSSMRYRNLLPHAAFRMQKRRASRPMIFLRQRPPKKKGVAAPCSSPVVIATHSSSRRTEPPSFIPSAPGRWRALVPDEVRARYGVDPKQVPDFIALRGDSSDKIPGAQAWAQPPDTYFLNAFDELPRMAIRELLEGSVRRPPDQFPA